VGPSLTTLCGSDVPTMESSFCVFREQIGEAGIELSDEFDGDDGEDGEIALAVLEKLATLSRLSGLNWDDVCEANGSPSGIEPYELLEYLDSLSTESNDDAYELRAELVELASKSLVDEEPITSSISNLSI